MAFEGEVRDDFGLPCLLQFDKPDNDLFALDSFPLPALHGAAMFYHQDGENDLRFHNKILPSPPGGQRYSCLIPVPTEWAPWFLDNSDSGTTFRHLIFLMQEAEQHDRELLQHFAASITYACGLPDSRANCPVSALLSKWRWVTYSKATLHWQRHSGRATRLSMIRWRKGKNHRHQRPMSSTASLGGHKRQ